MRKLGVAWLALLFGAQAVAGKDRVDEFVALQLGTFTSEAQSRGDDRYGVAIWHLAEIWPGGPAGDRWLYTESWMRGADRPYMQRISRVSAGPDGTIVARRYTLPDPQRYVGAWQAPERFSTLSAAKLSELDGCETVFAPAGPGRFAGGTVGTRCRNAYRGAAYAVSRSTLSWEGMMNWDRGLTSTGELAWGPADGGYEFVRVLEDAEDSPPAVPRPERTH